MPSVVPLLTLLAACGAPAPVEISRLAEAPPAPPPDPRAPEAAPAESARLPLGEEALRSAANGAAAATTEPRLGLTLDRPLYRPGETVWARVWALGAGFGASERRDVVVELVDPRGSVVQTRRYANGEGTGSPADLDLPSGAAGGVWSLRARVGGREITRPFGVAAFEEPRIRKELELLRDAYAPGERVTAALTVSTAAGGPLVDHPVQVLVQVAGEALPPIEARTDTRGEALLDFALPAHLSAPDAVVTVVVEEDGWSEAVSRPIPVVLSGMRIEAFPEGGTWVQGLPGRMYLRIRDAAGQPADAEGVVEDEAGREVARFRTLHDGLARVDLAPFPGRSYRARITSAAGSEPVALPDPAREGCVLRTWDDPEGRLPELRAGVWCSTPRTVVVSGHLRGHGYVPAAVEAGPRAPAVVHLRTERPEDGLLQGVATVTVSDPAAGPLAERLVYRNRARSLAVTLEPTATRFGPRDAVELVVTTRDPSGEPVPADLALSVVDDRLLAHADDEHGNLLSQLHLAPHLSGEPDDPAWYFDPAQPDAGRGLDLVLGTFGWRSFVRPDAGEGRAGSPDAGEGARAKREEGKVGKRRGISAEVARDAGILGGLVGAPIGEVGAADGFGFVGGAIGGGGTGEGGLPLGLLGTKGRGEALGFGGLGARGMGSGASGYGKGGGTFGAKASGGGQVVVGGDPIVLGSLDRSGIQGVIARHFNQIRYCYQRELVKKPDLAGKIVVKFTIAADGTVPAAEIKSTSMQNPAVESCLTGRFLRMAFPPVGTGLVVVSYPFLFRPDGPAGGSGAYAEPVRDVVRVFAQPDYAGRPAPKVRDDLRSTVAWLPSVRTGTDGTARVRFFLADPITTWRVTAEGVGGGHAGRAERELASTLPFSLDVPLPTEVTFGDRLAMPIRLANRTDAAADVALTATVSAPLVAEDGTGAQRLRLAAGEGVVTTVPVSVPDVIGTATIEVSAMAGSLGDALRRELVVAPRGFPHRFAAGGRVTDAAEHVVHIDDALPGGTSAALVLYPSPVSGLLDGAEALVRMPGGCFEQTSSTNHPNVLVLEYLDRVGGGAGLAVDRTSALREGYRRLTGYQVSAGGFETFGSGPGKEALSAYGLLQFDRMARVFPEVDRAVTQRDVAFLLHARDGSGGYRSSGASSHAYGRAPAQLNDAYITRALVETGHLTAGPEVERQRALAEVTTDPYLLALATLTLARLGEDVAQPAARLAAMSGDDGAFRGAATSVEASGGQDLVVETTGLAALALLRAGRPAEATAAARWLGAARQGSWGWGNTQATVLALEAISAVSAADRGAPGAVRVLVDGREVADLRYTGAERGPVRVALDPALLGPGEHRVRVVHDGARELPYALEAEWRRDTPADAPGAPLHLETALSADDVALGHTVRLTATVTNTTEGGVASPIARVRLPAGVRVEAKALERLKEQGQVAFFETRPREVTLYWEGFAGGERREIGLDLVAEVPGTFSAPPSVVYPYYTSAAVDWSAGATLHVAP